MILFPAVDVQGGKAVRLKQGLANESTVFAADPLEAALRWQEAGARYLHLVDLDGAFAGVSPNTATISRLCAGVRVPVQLGGGIRSEASAKRWLDAGVTRIIIGTLALEDPASFARLCACFPGQIGVSLDAVDGRLKTRGWVHDSGLMIEDLIPRLVDDGAAFLIYTDISRDGMQTGVNLPAITRISSLSAVPVIAAGGVATMDDVRALFPLSRSANLHGAVTGRALYEGTLNLGEALAWIARQ